MADPFDALRLPVAPVAPDPAFAARLRRRIEAALALPEGTDMPRAEREPEATTTSTEGATTPTGVTPYLAVTDARRALAWYAEVFGALPRTEPLVMPDGRVGHAELELDGGVVMLADEHPEIGFVAPVAGQGSTVTLHLHVPDVDGATSRAVASGARLDRPPADHSYGRNAVVVDPFGHRWMIAGSTTSAATARRPHHVDVSYASLWVPDVERAARFYQAVLAWRYVEGSTSQGRRVEGVSPPLGLWGGQSHTTTFVCFAVEDVAAAVQRVRTAGGRAEEPRHEPYGLVADCVDDQGMAFAVSEAGAGQGVGPPAPARHGELVYLTVGVPDADRARTFFASVLGWRFSPGRSAGGWDVEGVRPRAGMYGGSEHPLVVPMFAVDDIVAAVDRVRTAGGSPTEPEQMPYGITADCVDDQGGRFWLGQLG